MSIKSGNGSPLVLAKFKFGDMNAYRHRRAYIKFNFRVFNLAIYTEFAKLKTSPKFPAIQYYHAPSSVLKHRVD